MSDYREALELTTLTKRAARTNQSQFDMVINSISQDVFETRQEIITRNITRGLTKLQVIRVLQKGFKEELLIKIPVISDNRLRLYKRRGVMG